MMFVSLELSPRYHCCFVLLESQAAISTYEAPHAKQSDVS